MTEQLRTKKGYLQIKCISERFNVPIENIGHLEVFADPLRSEVWFKAVVAAEQTCFTSFLLRAERPNREGAGFNLLSADGQRAEAMLQGVEFALSLLTTKTRLQPVKAR